MSMEDSQSNFLNNNLSQNYKNFNNEAIRISELLDTNTLTREEIEKTKNGRNVQSYLS